MTRTVNCIVLGHEAEGLDLPPYPGELGQRIFENVSKEAWRQWLAHQTMLINENRLSPVDPKARAFLEGESWTPLALLHSANRPGARTFP